MPLNDDPSLSNGNILNEPITTRARRQKIAIIVGSQRKPRAGRQVADFVLGTIKRSKAAENEALDISMIDLADVKLPLTLDEPDIPRHMTSIEQYTREYTREWSTEISKYSAYVFVTPEYNASIPANLKNAIDWLDHEWKAKPAIVVSYGPTSGVRAANALVQILKAVRMKPIEQTVNLQFQSGEFMGKAIGGQPLNLDANNVGSVWSDQQENIVDLFDQLMSVLELQSVKADGE